ncbi:MAG: hypothetical protein RO257_06385 [Candidatus Kapabacteria bacterium]|nr:hypothetical protein [Candidatus Kapabacteria bacterium]
MTEIKIEKKKPIMVWIVLAIAVIALLIYFLGYYNDNKENYDTKTTENITEQPTDLINVKENNSIVAAYINFVEYDKNNMNLEHDYTHEALLKLTEAVQAMANETGVDVKTDIDKVKEYADRIQDDAYATTHANDIRKAADILTNALRNLQQAKYPGLANDVNDLKNASESINPDVLALDQKDAIKSFFRKASDLLKKMN